MDIKTINIFGIPVSRLNYKEFLDFFTDTLAKDECRVIAYANAHTLNMIYENSWIRNLYLKFDLIHPDGIGVYLASKFLHGSAGLEERITGSDFYEKLIEESIKNNWSYFFFGHDDKILKNIEKVHPQLLIKGFNEGYRFNSDEVVRKINSCNADILIIGLSVPLQEYWIEENKAKLNSKIILSVGDGIRVFAGMKYRGPVLARKAGLEWLFRYLSNPVMNFRKYIIGNNLFIYRIIKEKLKRQN